MELRHLRYFVAVAEELHFGRAAERLHVSQPPLSQQIKQLEEEVEVRLFDRSKRWVRLTGAGRLFLESAREILARADGAVLAARRAMGGSGERLSVACAPWAQFMAVPRILHRLRGLHREVQIDLQTLDSLRQARAIKARSVDVGFMCPGSRDKTLEMERLAARPLVVALPSHHRLAARAHLSPRDLAGECYVMLAPEVAPAYAEIVTDYWEETEVVMKEQVKADEPHAVIGLVTAGAGFALVPSSVQEYEKTRIVCRPLDPAPPELELWLAWARGVESPALNALLEAARQVVGQPTSHAGTESGGDSRSGDSGFSGLAPLSRLGESGHNRTDGAHLLDARDHRSSAPLNRHKTAEGSRAGTARLRDVRGAQAS